MFKVKTPCGQPIDCGIDWLTLTIQAGNPQYKKFWNNSRAWLVESLESGEGLKDQNNGFYTGWRGRHFFTGDNEKGTIVEVSGSLADAFATEYLTWGIQANCTRLDAQTTIEYEVEPTHHGTRMRRAVRRSAVADGPGARPDTAVYENDSRDTGLTIGTRGNARYLRAYHAYSGGHKQFSDTAFRYEVEYRKETAKAALALYHGSMQTGPLSRSLVQSELLRLGIAFDWYESTECPKLKPVYEKTDNEKRLEWLMLVCTSCVGRVLADEKTRGRALEWLSSLSSTPFDLYGSAALKHDANSQN